MAIDKFNMNQQAFLDLDRAEPGFQFGEINNLFFNGRPAAVLLLFTLPSSFPGEYKKQEVLTLSFNLFRFSWRNNCNI